jgi:hypothetical protein
MNLGSVFVVYPNRKDRYPADDSTRSGTIPARRLMI